MNQLKTETIRVDNKKQNLIVCCCEVNSNIALPQTGEAKKTAVSAAPRKTMNEASLGCACLQGHFPLLPRALSAPLAIPMDIISLLHSIIRLVWSSLTLARQHSGSHGGGDPCSSGWSNASPLCSHTKQCLLLARYLFLQLQPNAEALLYCE